MKTFKQFLKESINPKWKGIAKNSFGIPHSPMKKSAMSAIKDMDDKEKHEFINSGLRINLIFKAWVKSTIRNH